MQTLFLSNLRCGDHGFDALDTLSHPVVLSEDYHAIATAPQRARHRLLDTLILKELVRLLKKDAIYLASDYAASFRVRPSVASGAAIDLTIPDWCYSPGRALLISLQASFARHDAETIQVIRARLYDTTIAQVSGDVELLQRKTQTDLQLLLAAHKAARRPSDHVESDLADHIVTMFGHYDRQLYGPTCDHLRMTEESSLAKIFLAFARQRRAYSQGSSQQKPGTTVLQTSNINKLVRDAAREAVHALQLNKNMVKPQVRKESAFFTLCKKKSVCHKFQMGTCTRGADCNWKHVKMPAPVANVVEFPQADAHDLEVHLLQI